MTSKICLKILKILRKLTLDSTKSGIGQLMLNASLLCTVSTPVIHNKVL